MWGTAEGGMDFAPQNPHNYNLKKPDHSVRLFIYRL